MNTGHKYGILGSKSNVLAKAIIVARIKSFVPVPCSYRAMQQGPCDIFTLTGLHSKRRTPSFRNNKLLWGSWWQNCPTFALEGCIIFIIQKNKFSVFPRESHHPFMSVLFGVYTFLERESRTKLPVLLLKSWAEIRETHEELSPKRR